MSARADVRGAARRGTLALVAASLAGCYSTQPVTTAPAPGTIVLLNLTDRGRVALGDRIGPSARTIEGVLRERNDSAYAVNISAVEYLGGQSNKWSGEPFSVPVGLVETARERRFSRSRTAAVGLGIGAALLAAILKTSFFGSGGTVTEPPTVPPPIS